ncbi:MAG: DUF433 domain-containing protein [Anaerolineae bacterium]|nr:DUF433 domain-containing protein [Anaerolineae bacterium]
MISTPAAEPVPIEMGEDGVIRVGGTRVTLQTLVTAFYRGASPEEIVEQYPVLTLPDVYLVIGYYLQHRASVDDYLQAQTSQAAQVQQENEARFEPQGVRARLLARLDAAKNSSI